MGGTPGHVSLGFAFIIIGLWHLFNCTKLHVLNPKSYTTLPWFPLPRLKHFELISIMIVSVVFVSTELFVGRTPILLDGTISSKNVPHLEHSAISMSFFVSSFLSIVLDKIAPPAQHGLVYLLQATAFSQQVLILHLHSTDHMGVEGRYHWLLQMVTFVSLITTLLAIGHPKSFLNAFARAYSVILQGIWLVVIGVMLWTPQLIPKGCYLKSSDIGRDTVSCHGEHALERAKALVNIRFGWYMMGLTIFSTLFYSIMSRLYHPQERIEYQPLCYKSGEQDGGKYNDENVHENKNCVSVSSCLPM
ncbi:uncharacterized protein [Primulina eburnea]|uniref:uncharacterized protein n=1 Tax=Primulina eburnea TaxID=1245227 RepID=UPI003C6C55F7